MASDLHYALMDFPVWNVVIGSQGREFRISPITEADVDFNRFSATVHTDDMRRNKNEESLSTLNKVIFQIRTIPVDLGFVYPGEAIMLNIGSFVSLPQESMSYKWFLERDGEAGTLPSNMKTSPSGGSVAISELRKEQEGVLTCSVYTNKGIFATKKRFLIKELFEDVLISMDSRNNTNVQRRSSHLKTLKRHTRHVKSSEFYDPNSAQENAEIKERDPEYSNPSQLGYAVDDISSEMNNVRHDNAQESRDGETQTTGEIYEPNEPIAQNTNVEQSLNLAPESDRVMSDAAENSEMSELTHKPHHNPDEHLTSNGAAEMNSHVIAAPHHNTMTQQQEIEQPKESIHRIHVLENHGDRDLTLQIFKETNNKEMQAEDKIARLMSFCKRDTQCSGYGVCIRKNFKVVGFCRCLPGYHGNGVFCWEDVNVRNAPPQDNDKEATSTHSHFVMTRQLEKYARKRRMPVHKRNFGLI